MNKLRIGIGYDVHQLTPDRDLILGGVKIEHTKGLLGHSDADVLLHAICDSLLGAAALGDIGRHFPDNDPAYKGISSLILLEKTAEKVRDSGYDIGNVDATIVAQKPKLMPYIDEMIKNISDAMGVERDKINIKATTTERLGFEGREEGISSHSICLLNEKKG